VAKALSKDKYSTKGHEVSRRKGCLCGSWCVFVDSYFCECA
jgi:hypothetical protein